MLIEIKPGLLNYSHSSHTQVTLKCITIILFNESIDSSIRTAHHAHIYKHMCAITIKHYKKSVYYMGKMAGHK